MKHTKYNKQTGQIVGVIGGVTIPDDNTTHGFIEGGYNPATEYIAAGGVTNRTPITITLSQPIAESGDVIVISGVPNDVWLMVNGNLTQQKTHTMPSHHFVVVAVGKYSGEAKCEYASKEIFDKLALQDLLIETLKNSQAGQNMLNNPNARRQRALRNLRQNKKEKVSQ